MNIDVSKQGARVGAVILGLALSLGAAIAPAQTQVIDEVVAIVDTEPILRSDLLAEVAMLETERDMALREVLDRAIEQKILYRQARLSGLEVPDTAVEERLDTIRASYDSNDQFLRALREAGETIADFRETLRKQMLALAMGMRKRQEFERAVTVTESDMRQYYHDNQERFAKPERIRVRRIFLGAGRDAGERAAVRGRLEELRQEILDGGDFGALARAHSEGPDADNGGLVGWVGRGDLVEPLDSVVFGLATGEVSEIAETEWGFHVLRAEERLEAGGASYEEVRTEIEPIIRAEAANERYQRWMDELRKRSRVRILM
ncbi:MAG: peptidylprolyl isomerase [Nocardiopsis sp. BM-2018]|nr:MAG: peptidylprolyl isomerase [Nocardiopsis sp. BM-2018]